MNIKNNVNTFGRRKVLSRVMRKYNSVRDRPKLCVNLPQGVE